MTRRPEPRRRMTEQEIRSVVDKFADIARVLIDADPDDKAEIFRQLGLKLTCHPGRQLVKAQIEASQHWQIESVRGRTRQLRTCPRLVVSWSSCTAACARASRSCDEQRHKDRGRAHSTGLRRSPGANRGSHHVRGRVISLCLSAG